VRQGLFVILAAVALGVCQPSSAGTPDFQIVVNPSVHGSWISRSNLQALFTGKSARWGDHAFAKPVDQSVQSPVRHAFTTSVLGLSMGEVQRYWQERVVTDRVFPPPIKASDGEVLGFVAANEGAVGYVGPDTVIPEGVKVISIVE
jgi:ABC-type phosphate transport system substrate-binding protein